MSHTQAPPWPWDVPRGSWSLENAAMISCRQLQSVTERLISEPAVQLRCNLFCSKNLDIIHQPRMSPRILFQVGALQSPSPAEKVLTEARLWEELECLLGSMEEIPLSVSLLLLPGLWTLLLEYPAVGKVTQKNRTLGPAHCSCQ